VSHRTYIYIYILVCIRV